ncbi:MAG TPA: NAD-dependent DNA ligase LigA [Thermotogota bacterium]|nr:NAD-dependent DNA ligase LigA [Thermotogota bacterium]
MNNREVIKKRIETLRKEIETHDYRYYVLAQPEVDDQTYDALYKELVRLETENPEFYDSNSPTQNVGAKILDTFVRVEHSVPMLSLDNTYNEEDIFDWSERVRKLIPGKAFKYCVELKIDGVSFAARYVAGKLERGISRGNGTAGEDITEHLKQVKGLPKTLKSPIDIEVRGEVYIPNEVFAEVNRVREENGLEVFANPRNSTAGTLRQLNTLEVKKRGLRCFVYSIVNPEAYGLESQSGMLNWLEEQGFSVEDHFRQLDSIPEVIDFWTNWTFKRHDLPFDVDGLVVKVDEFAHHEELGQTSHSPRWMIAFKFPAEQKETTLESLTWSVGRTGVITPVAHFTPIQLAGTTVKNANLHNMDNIKEKDIRIKDTVIVEKAGEIIPQVVRIVSERRNGSEIEIVMPESCPVCGGEIGKLKAEEVAVRCLNPQCPAKIKRSLETFVSRDAMNIEGMGEKIIDQLVEEKMISDISDIYHLKEERLIPLPRMGQKSANNLVREIEKSKRNQLHALLTGFGIPNVGKKTAKELAIHFRTLKKIMSSGSQELIEVDGVGEEMASAVVRFFASQQVKRIVERLAQSGVNMEEVVEEKKATLAGMRFVITGTLEKMTRNEIKVLIESEGGTVTGSISKKTDYLVCGTDAGSKYDKALKAGVKIITEEEFMELLG